MISRKTLPEELACKPHEHPLGVRTQSRLRAERVPETLRNGWLDPPK
jgi:hypothetical protein